MTSSATEGERRIALAAVSGAHGITGELRLKLFADDFASFIKGTMLLVNGEPRKLLAIKGTPKAPIARFEGIPDRTAAEQLRGTLIEIDRSTLAPLDEGEYYHADLIGLPCVDAEGLALGTVSAIENFGASDLLEVERGGGLRSLIPFVPPMAVLEADRVVLDPDFLT